MPIYDYECPVCGYQIEHACRIADRPESMPCGLACSGQMRQIITASAIQCDDAVNVPWIREFADSRPEARFKQPKIESRADYRRYLKDKDLRPADGPNLSEV